MNRSIIMTAILSAAFLLASGCASAGKFGERMTLAKKDTVCIKEVLATPAKFEGKLLRVGGKVQSVCAKKGCWLRLGDGEKKETLFVKFTCPVDGRLIPMKAVGKTAFVEGTLELKEISQDEARHYKEDSGASKEEIEKIVGPQKIAKLNAPAAQIVGL